MSSLRAYASLLLTCLVSSHALADTIRGTGATFPAVVYAEWAKQHERETRIAIDFVPSGSSTGVKQVVARAVDFGATDVPMSQADLDKHQLFQFPTLVGGVVPVVNLPGIASGRLRLSAEVLAAIFAGRITQWNERPIAALNPGLHLPDARIVRVVRGDGSGTTEVFVRFLKQAAPAAALALELSGSRARWPGATVAVEGSSKVADAVQSTPGAISYISSDYAQREQMTAVSLRNKRGEWVQPTVDSFAAASRAGGLFRTSLEAAPLLDIDGAGVWPIVTATYVLVPRSPASVERGSRTLNFFYRSFLLGDKAVAGSGFAPLPVMTQARIVGHLTNFRAKDGQLIPVLSASAPAPRATPASAPARTSP